MWVEYYWESNFCISYCRPSQDYSISVLALKHSPKWKLGTELSLGPRLFPERNFSPEGISPALGKLWTSPYCLRMCVTWHLAYPISVSAPSAPAGRKGMGSSTAAQDGCAQHITLLIRRDLLAMGDWHTLQMLIVCFFSFPWVKHYSNQGLVC